MQLQFIKAPPLITMPASRGYSLLNGSNNFSIPMNIALPKNSTKYENYNSLNIWKDQVKCIYLLQQKSVGLNKTFHNKYVLCPELLY
jgi:hypothetical protein